MEKPVTSNQKPEKILIRAPNWLGDSVMSIPTVANVKRLFPGYSVCIWTKPGLLDLWRFVPEVDNVLDSVPKGHSFKLGILLTNSFGSALRMYLAKVPKRRGYSTNWRRFLLTQPVKLKNGWKNLHQIEYFLGIVDGIGGAVPKIDISEQLKSEAKEFLINNGWDGETDIIGIHATSSYGPAKCWLAERFVQLIDKLRGKYNPWILIIGSKEEKEDIEDILIKVGNRDRMINLAGQTDIKMLSGVLSLCSVLVANDSGPMHLAAALGIPVVAIFGSTDPNRTGPRGKSIIIRKDLSCSPCFKRICPKNLECMQMIDVEDVMEAVSELMNEIDEVEPRSLAVVMKDYDESRGGAERYLVNLMSELGGKFASVDLIVNKAEGTPPKGVNVKLIKAIRWSSILEPLTFNWSVQKLIKKNKYDLVYGLTQIYPQGIYRVGGGLEHSWFKIRYPKLQQRLLNYIRPKNLVRLYIENKIFSKGNYNKIITNSNLCKNQILHHYRISPEDIVVVYNGVDKKSFNPETRALYRDKVRLELGIGKDDKVILFISNNWKRKGLRELIRAFAIINCGWLIIAGRGKKRLYIKLAKKYRIEDKIKFIGPIKEPERYYGASSVFVLPTYYDPFANVCIEALSCGLPVVTTQTNGAAEFIIDGKNGYIVNDVSDIKGLADCISKAFLLKGNVCNLSIEENVQKTIDVLRDINRTTRNEILINSGYREFLEKKGWLNFSNVMQEESGSLYKKNKLRSVVKIDINGKKIFLKRHFKNAYPSWALKEWQNIFRLRSIGISTMNPVAMGEKGGESFIITESLESAERLEDFIKRDKLDFSEKRVLIQEIASLTKKMHKNYLFHKDFYTGHIFVKRNNGYEIYLIDLQRLCQHWLFKTRWRIKDLASLNFSSIGSNITDKDKLRFLWFYMNKDKLSKNRRFIEKILAKTNRIARHTEKMLKKRGVL